MCSAKPSLCSRFCCIRQLPKFNEQKKPASETANDKRVSIIQLYRFATCFDIFVLAIGVLSSVIVGGTKIMSALMPGLIADLMVKKDFNLREFGTAATWLICVYLAGACAVAVASIMAHFTVNMASDRIIHRVRHAYLAAILRQDARWFDDNKSGALIVKFNENTDCIRKAIGEKCAMLFRTFSSLITAIAVAFAFQWQLTVILLGVVPVSVVLMAAMGRMTRAPGRSNLAHKARAGVTASEAIHGATTVIACNGQRSMLKRYSQALKTSVKFALRVAVWTSLFGGLFFVAIDLFIGSGFFYGAYLVKENLIEEPGTVLIVVSSVLTGAYYIGMFAPHFSVILQARTAAVDIYETIDTGYQKTQDTTSKNKPSVGAVQFENVHFSYDADDCKKKVILNGLTFYARPGETVALVGHSGCGKSTMMRLLTGEYCATLGRVAIDGIDLQDLDIAYLRSTLISLVEQEPVLFNMTIAENLRISAPQLDRAGMEKICRIANAHDFIMQMKDNYNTRIGDGATQLSGGQKQRIAIARALANDPRILLCDEATSALDAESEFAVQAALSQAAHGRTTIMIAHRLSSLRNVDRIVVVDNGRVVEQGTHRELLDLKGKYYERFQCQNEIENSVTVKSQSANLLLPKTETFPEKQPYFRSNSLAMRVNSVKRASVAIMNNLAPGASRAAGGIRQLVVEMSGRQRAMFLVNMLFAVLRGMELPAFACLMGLSFLALKAQFEGSTDADHTTGLVWSMFVVLGIVKGVLDICVNVASSWLSEIVAASLQARILNAILMQDGAFLHDPLNSPGKLTSTICRTTTIAKAVLSTSAMQVCTYLTSFITIIIVASILCWQLATLGTGTLVVCTIAQIVLSRLAARLDRRRQYGAASDVAVELITKARTIQRLNGQHSFLERFDRAITFSRTAATLLDALSFALAQSCRLFCDSAVFWLGTVMLQHGMASSLQVYGVSQLVSSAAWAVSLGCLYLPDLINVSPALSEIFKIIQSKSKFGSPDQGIKMEITGKLEIRNATFAYPHGRGVNVLNGFSLKADKGQSVALVGPSGSGKSTIVGFLQRLYVPDRGFVLLDGQSVNKLNMHSVRCQIAMVGQEPRLFSGTIRDNIVLGMDESDVNLDRVMAACKMANAADFIQQQPLGYDTEVGENGAQLSGGQKQRIAIARALIRNPRILLLDEATSALDVQSESTVQKALDAAKYGRTCIIVAHRLSTIRDCDQILYVHGGQVIESGTHDELMSLNGSYANLVLKQELTE